MFQIKTITGLIVALAVTVHQASATPTELVSGFEDDHWRSLTENFGFADTHTSYTDARGITFMPTEGSYFMSLWGNNDAAHALDWAVGDQLSFDWAIAEGNDPLAGADVRLFAALGDGLTLFEPLHTSLADATSFTRVNHTFTQSSPESGNGLLVFQAQGASPLDGFFSNTDVGRILIDNVRIGRADTEPDPDSDPAAKIPEPSSALLVGSVLLFGRLRPRRT